jgi:hypothetical protein
MDVEDVEGGVGMTPGNNCFVCSWIWVACSSENIVISYSSWELPYFKAISFESVTTFMATTISSRGNILWKTMEPPHSHATVALLCPR